MDAHDQLLLSEGVCRQLGILTYHPDIKAKKSGSPDEQESEGVATVPTIRMCLLQSVRVPAGRSVLAPVHFQGSDLSGKSMLLEHGPSLEESTGLQLEDALVRPADDGIAYVRICNSSGFTSKITGGTVVGAAVEATEVSPCDDPKGSSEQREVPEIRKVSADTDDERKQELLKKLEEPDLPDPGKTLLRNFLIDNHLAFSLRAADRGETDLVEMVIETGDASPKEQPVRRMPFAVRSEVARQLKEMQSSGVIQPSISHLGLALLS